MKRILIVDDEPHVIRILRLALERQGYKVVSAPNGTKALECIDEASPDVLITDICMPQMDGRKLCKTVRLNYPMQKFLILVMTSNTERDEREWVKDLSNIDFLEKPLSPIRLVAKLEEYFKNISGDMGDVT